MFFPFVCVFVYLFRNNYAEDAESLLTASCALEMVNKHSALKHIQRAVHLDPENKGAWNALLEMH